MSFRKTPEQRRAALPRSADYTKAFRKDWLRLQKAGRVDMHRLKEVMLLLIANDGSLGPEWRDHELVGDWRDHRECHVGGDFLLIYLLNLSDGIVFVRTGTHAELFR